MNGVRRLWRFTLAVFPPHVTVTYAVLWVLALESSVVALADRRWTPSVGTLVRVASVILALFYLRVVDEQKDLAYDRKHNPDRPLVRGDVSRRELLIAMVAVAATLIGVNVWFSLPALTVLVVDLGYALLLVVAERRSARLRNGIWVNLAVTHPVQVLLSVYIYLSVAAQIGEYVGWRAVPLLAVFVCAYLHYEFARKTVWDGRGRGRLYSGVLGPVRSTGLVTAVGTAAVVLVGVVFPPWRAEGLGLVAAALSVATLAFPLLGMARFLRRTMNTWPVSLAMGFVITTYLSLTLQAVTT